MLTSKFDGLKKMHPSRGLNPEPSVLKTDAPPLSYTGYSSNKKARIAFNHNSRKLKEIKTKRNMRRGRNYYLIGNQRELLQNQDLLQGCLVLTELRFEQEFVQGS